MRLARLLGISALLAVAAPTSAATFLFAATGTAGELTTVDAGYRTVATPATAIHAGDSVSASFVLETTGLLPDPTYAADPTVRLYTARVSDFTLDIGSYHLAAPPGSTDFVTIQLWNDHSFGGSGPVDGFAISALRELPAAASPVALGSGTIDQLFGVSAYDFSGAVRSSVDIDEEPPLDSYGFQSAFAGFLDPATGLQTVVPLNLGFLIEPAPIEAAVVPEAPAWALLVTGFGLCGTSLRRRRRPVPADRTVTA